MIAVRGLLALLAFTSGCYAAYPLGHKRAVPPAASASARLELRPKNHTSWYSCGGDLSKCEVRAGKLERPVRSVRYYPYYDGESITLGQFQALTDPMYGTKWDQIESKKGMCNLSIAPTALYFAGAIASVVGFTMGANTDNEKLFAYGGAGVMVFGAAISYPMGGYACRSAGKIAKDLEVRYANGDYEVNNNAADKRKLAAMQAAIDAYNRGERPRPPGEPTDTPATDLPPAETLPTASDEPPSSEGFVPGTSSIMKTLADAGEFKEFSAMIVETGVDREIAKGGPYMVLAPTDATIAKIKDKSFRKDKALLTRSVRDLIIIGVVSSGEHTLPTLAGTTATLEFKKNGRLKRKQFGSSILLGPATNGVIYRRE